jgi:hypothetical protein
VLDPRPQATCGGGARGLTSRVRGWPGIEICDRVPDAIESVDALIQRAALN